MSFYAVAILLQGGTVYYCSQHTHSLDLDLALADRRDKDKDGEEGGGARRESDDEDADDFRHKYGPATTGLQPTPGYARSHHSSHSRHSRKPRASPSIGVS